jgi:acetyltransferase-like isoleucine patch superfamily enzyme
MAWERPILEHGVPTKWLWVVWYPEGFALGKMTDIGAYTFIQAKRGVVIEDEVQIGSHCAIYSISTVDGKAGPVRIRRGARIGSHSVIMPGVEIGEGAVVGACSFVNRDVPAGATVYGSPAREA